MLYLHNGKAISVALDEVKTSFPTITQWKGDFNRLRCD
ncbi:hypothetical protein SPONL_1723 [uncultured Candidatus Thioglobus sp.]|nr:hypothetical protein SPONL_1723 [uncultured Candidatus Thioglobus sp.]